MLTRQYGLKRVRIVEQPIATHGLFVAWQGWYGNQPHLYLTMGLGKPLESKTFAIPRDRMAVFCTPGTLSSLYAGDRPMDPRACAMYLGDAAKALGAEPDEFNLSLLLDCIQSTFDTMHAMPSYAMVEKGGDRETIGDVRIHMGGQLAYEGEARV